MSSDAAKSNMREQARARRIDISRTAGPESSLRLAENAIGVLSRLSLPARPTIAGYWPVGSEIDVRPLMARVVEAGMRCALPVVESQTTPLSFRDWHPDRSLVNGPLGTRQPDADCKTVTPDVVFTPLVAFDSAGYRVGQGGGYYDRTLQSLRKKGRVVAVGVAFEAQRVGVVVKDAHDQRLDWIVTEAGAARFE